MSCWDADKASKESAQSRALRWAANNRALRGRHLDGFRIMTYLSSYFSCAT